jgi:hypothetical protein
VRVRATPDTDDLNVTAFILDQQKTFTIVFVTIATDAIDVHLQIPATPAINAPKVLATTAEENFAVQPEARITKGKTSLSLPARSIVTICASFGAGK